MDQAEVADFHWIMSLRILMGMDCWILWGFINQM